MKIEPGRAIIFIIVLLVMGAIVHIGLKFNVPQTADNQLIPAPQPPPPRAEPTVSISKIWPDGATPTKIVHIPDPQEPAKGLMEIRLHHGDDLELDFEPFWTLITKDNDKGFPGAKVAIDSGKGFETFEEYHANRSSSGTNAWWLESRIMRMRLAPGHSDITYSCTVQKISPEGPLPSVPPQTFGDLSIIYGGIRDIPDRKALVYLTFRNNSTVNTIAVAMYDQPCNFMPCELESSLLCSDGTPYIIYTSELTGINGLWTSPRYLTAIEPGQELKASLTFEPRGSVSPTISSVRLQAEIVLNPNYRPSEYYNYRETKRDFLPPYCTVINAMFDIPLRPHD